MDEPTPEVLEALLRARGFAVPSELLVELAPAVRDLWELGEQLQHDLAALDRGEA